MELLHKGKVRDIYSDRPGEILLVASDRVSTFDIVHPTPIPDKGKVLTALSLWWFDQVADLIPNHVLSADDVPAELKGQAIRCRQVEIVPVECIARGYLAGTGLLSYGESGTISGVELPPGLREGDQLAEPIFTPSTKVPVGQGHDEAMTYDEVVALVGAETAAQLRALTLGLYARGVERARERGVIVADTKFEFGRDTDGRLVLADEVFTPDSSRFWAVEDWEPGRPQHSMDKQYLRDWASSTGWNKQEPAPEIPADVVAEVRRRYIAMYEQLTGARWEEGVGGGR
ncbi:phosphoribosylaminoimidazolesuccinocarboxamide synthase [Tenggerimyces flavus]|uniref:Phosphoribosylaminoimidazole-succinocarboxamide synthase n=1 Tax=Tenggerimyces flavus TaxID=1708749 RepID=A0ABV7YPX7_9ACTN|nr:phosphoribosylaminoimidazolesuccinocarboxamide synthase [Tenggerimyces flavus]MBM7784957.1 phosphoribosylaminoimidazole-succinocarboxamide synthase [Tenggerimyces flavus]